jgi:D-alanyl-D-alanine carboxypeptidase
MEMKYFILVLISVLTLSCMVEVPLLTDADYIIPHYYPENTVPQDKVNYYQSVLDGAAKSGLPGISMVIDTPEGFWAGAAGLIDVPNRIETKKYSLFRIGSTTKPFTAAMVLSMEADGLLDIDDLIADYLPREIIDNIANGDKVTIRQLLSHKSGIKNYYSTSLHGLVYGVETINNFSNHVWTTEEFLEFIYGKREDFAPGTDHLYSNTNYILLGLIMEGIDGKSYAEILSDRILDPLGLSSTYHAYPGQWPKGMARGYEAFYGDNTLYDVTESTSDYNEAGGDGGLVSNTYDVARFFRGLFDLELFGQDQLDEMLTQEYSYESEFSPGSTGGYCLGLFFWDSVDTGLEYSHPGYIYGYTGDAFYFPETDTVAVFFHNTTYNPMVDERTSKVYDLLYEVGEGE